MKKLLTIVLIISITGLFSCCPKEKKETAKDAPIIEKKEMKLTSDLMTPEVLWSFGRLSEPAVSPDKSTILYGVTYYDIPQNKGNRELYTIGIDGKDLKRITTSKFSEYGAIWKPDGKRVGFMSAESGSMQMWEMNPDGSDRKQISQVEGGIGGFLYSPDGKLVLSQRKCTLIKPLRTCIPISR
jgi:Tol biopolymer transport system component